MAHQLSKSAFEALIKELETLKTVKRQEMAKRLEEARGFGDLSENFEYQQAKDEQGQLEKKIFEIERLLKDTEVIQHTKKPYLELGSRFEVENNSRKKVIFELVSSIEADPLKGKISIESPLGQRFLDKREGDEIEFANQEGKKIKYKIKKIID